MAEDIRFMSHWNVYDTLPEGHIKNKCINLFRFLSRTFLSSRFPLNIFFFFCSSFFSAVFFLLQVRLSRDRSGRGCPASPARERTWECAGRGHDGVLEAPARQRRRGPPKQGRPDLATRVRCHPVRWTLEREMTLFHPWLLWCALSTGDYVFLVGSEW